MELSKKAVSFMKMATGFKFRLFLLRDLPMGYLAGLRVKEITMEKCVITIPYKYLTKNPFRSMYFACLAMAAEMSTGALGVAATFGQKPSVAMLVKGIEGEFSKKAVGLISFTCTDGAKMFETVERSKLSGEGETITCLSIGTDETGDEVARFKLTWSFKARKP
ncbi:MAG: DUF4442 domain-containing protein [Flavobacteriales bacterium]|nr:DUF4442 domain-containing protein [Flavobacteriales bacterium]MBL4735839.1 DUF4442 domain-containing protein [Flavobacteriales bacterium]